MKLLEKVERENREWQDKVIKQVDSSLQRVDSGLRKIDEFGRQANHHHVANYILNALAIITSLVAAGIASGIIRIEWLGGG